MMKKFIWVGLAVTVLGVVSVSSVRADEWNKKTILTFSQPVEIPGHVLPAGTYTFKLADSMSDRHIVQVFNADGSQLIATVMAIPDYRLKTTDETVVKFGEVPAGSPEAIRAWFYPGNSVGQEFVYPKSRATQLAKAANAVVPAIAVDVTDADALKTVPVVAVTPDERELPVADVIQTTSYAVAGTSGVTKTAKPAVHGAELPKTASTLPLIALLGLTSIAVAVGLMAFGKRAAATVA